MFFVIFAIPRVSSNIIRVEIQEKYSSDYEVVEIPITPYTTCADIVNCLKVKEDNEKIFYLTHVWKSCERITTPEARPYVIIRDCDDNVHDSIFRLRNCNHNLSTCKLHERVEGENLERTAKVQSPNRSLSPESNKNQRQATKPNMAITEHEKLGATQGVDAHKKKPVASTSAESGGLTVEELRQISARQQNQIECQRRRLSEKTSRLRMLRQKDALKKKSGEAEDITTSKLRSSVEEHEFSIKQASAARMQLNETRFSNENMSLELDNLKTAFAEKQRELSRYTQRVEELKVALDQLRSTSTMKYPWKSDVPDKSHPPVLKSPNKFPAPGLIQAVNLELKAKFGALPETDDAKALSQKLEDKRRDSKRLDEQLALLRTRLGLKEAKTPPPVPIRSLSPQRLPRSAPVSPGSLKPESSTSDSSGSRYAPRSVIADTYMRRLRTGRINTGHFVSTAKFNQLKRGALEELTSSDSAEASKATEGSNNDSGRGPSIASDAALEDDVFAGRTAVPPPAAFDSDLTSSSTSQPNDFSDSQSSSDATAAPSVPTKPRKSCLKASCDVVQFAATRPTHLSLETSQEMGGSVTEPITPSGMKQSVSFDPLALLLDAAMEGEISLVKQTAFQVKDVSAGNDEGTTALHNSVCSGHDDVTRFLVTEACGDVNAVDIDGWTPLHCAASCASLSICRLLIEYGAAVFLCTNGDDETALEKCDEDADGGQRTAEYLFNVQEEMGVTNNGVVYAVFPYQAKNKDELSFAVNEAMTVLKRGDAAEIEWYWARNKEGVTGYIPRNFIALHPKQLPQKRPLDSPVEKSADNEMKKAVSETEGNTESSVTSGEERSDKTAL